MTYSRQALVTLALKELGVVGAGQQPYPEDYATVDATVDSVMADLALRNIYTWGDPDQTEDAPAVHLAAILAQANAKAFGAPKDENTRLLAEARLRELKQTYVTGQPQQTEYF